ncbi:RNA polymerase III subunit Rpc25-domain-containing protein [Melampsora americana]|nr:RNA polymerase III subunit Rpc25-domain-containing protein [Melampsora americana]
MFILTQIKDTIRVLARDFGRDRAKVLEQEINRKYANKVLPDVGLCLCLFNVVNASEGKVLYGDGCLYHLVEFTLAVFRPFIGESLVGVVKSSSPAGIRVSLRFFDDIHIPCRSLPFPSAYEPTLNEFFWASEYSDLEGQPEMPSDLLATPHEGRLYVQVGQPIRFRIEEEHFFDVGPKEAPKAPDPVPEGVELSALEQQIIQARQEGIPAYSLSATCSGQGLGIVAWWDEGEDDPNAMIE